jgi:arylsulfatase A-like enzyme
MFAPAQPLRAALAVSLGIWVATGCTPKVSGLAGLSSRPNVLIVLLDGARADHLGCFGYPLETTPHIDTLAREGLRFSDVVTPSPWSRPAFASLITGRYPSSIGMSGEAEQLAAGGFGLPSLLGSEGYATWAILSHPFMNPASGLGEGFDEFRLVVDRTVWPKGLSASLVTDAVLEQLDEVDGRPFFMVAHYADPLHDWAPIQGFEFGDPRYTGPLKGGLGMADLLRGYRNWTQADLAELRAHYDAELAYVDSQVGRLLAGLTERGLRANTLIVLTSTHGMQLFDHGGLGDSQTLHDELLHVPLLLAGPDVEPGLNEVGASLIDLAPTLCVYLGLDVPEVMQGSPVQALTVEGGRILFSETDRIRRRRAAMDERHKVILDLESGEVSMFDLVDDPHEVHDLADNPQFRSHRALLEAALERFMVSHD